jgi:hypothetical protein
VRFHLRIEECEHEGDVDYVMDPLSKRGVKAIKYVYPPQREPGAYETCVLEVEFDGTDAQLREVIKQTDDAYGMAFITYDYIEGG